MDGVATNKTQFCSGIKITFVCNIPVASYVWEIGSLLNERITVGEPDEIVDGITLRAQGNGNARTSSLTLTTSVKLNGQVVMCYELANRDGDILNSSISVWGECMVSCNLCSNF